MSSIPPFLTPDEAGEHISAGPWCLNHDPVGHGALIDGWNYATQVVLYRVIKLNPTRLRELTGLGRSSVIRLATAWSAQAAINLGSTGPVFEAALQQEHSLEITIELPIPSPCLAQEVRVTSALVLHRRGTDAESAFSAREPGSVLWSDAVTLTLEGTRPRLPVVPVDFGQFVSAEQGAAWCLWTSPEWLRQHPSTGLAVYINSKRTGILAALKSREPEPLDAVVQSMFFHDIGRAIVERALDDDDFGDEETYPDGSSGLSVRSTLAVVFKDLTLDQIRNLRRNDRASFERALQTRHRILGSLI